MALLLPTHPLFRSNGASSISSPTRAIHSGTQWTNDLKGQGLRPLSSGTPSSKIASYPSGSAIKAQGRSYLRLDSCLVVPPPAGRKPTAVVKFLGGAFIGAVPEVTYSYLIEWLAKEGFLVVSVPHNVTFDHEEAANEVYERFNSCMDSMLTHGIPDAGITALDISALPLYSVGHSNGALLQMLIGSYFQEKIPKANVIISFNNRPAAEAVPFFEQDVEYLSMYLDKNSCGSYLLSFGPLVSQAMPIIEESPMFSMARNFSGDAWKALIDTARSLIQEYDHETMVSLTKFTEQLPSVVNQVTQGISEFRPTPPQNRDFFKASYSVPHTLLVKFSVDAIDDTDLLEDILKPRIESIGGTLEKVTLAGNHLTPCVQDLRWQVGYQYTPADAVAQALKSLSLNETRTLAMKVIDWLNGINNK